MMSRKVSLVHANEAANLGQVFKVSTFHGSTLLAQMADGLLVSGSPGAAGTVHLYAYMTRADSHLAYLFADLSDGVYPRLEPMEAIGHFLPVGVTRSTSNEVVSFYSRRTRLFLMAMPHQGDAPPSPVLLVAAERQAYEQLKVHLCEEPEVPSRLSGAPALLNLVGEPEPDATSLLDFLMQVPLSSIARHVMTAAGLSLSRSQMRTFADGLAKSRIAQDRLRQHFPDDLIATDGILALLSWMDNREKIRGRGDGCTGYPARSRSKNFVWPEKTPSGVRFTYDNAIPHGLEHSACSIGTKHEIGVEFDHLDRLGTDGTFISLPFVAARHIRRTVTPRFRACIVATARNEGLYLLDWLAYHRALGFQRFFIYSNDNTDGSDPLLDALSKAGEITWISSVVREGVRPQWKAYNHALQILPDVLDYEWSLFIDLDEYLNLNHEVFADLEDYLAWCDSSSVDAIAFNWVMIGSNGEARWRDEPVRKRFPLKRKVADQHIKSMFRPRKFQASYPHHPVAFRGDEFIFRSPSMREHVFHREVGPALSIRPESEVAWVSHYFTKSYEEFLLKAARGRGDSLERSGLAFPGLEPDLIRWVVAEASSRLLSPAAHPLDNKVDSQLAYLLSLSELPQALHKIKQAFPNRAADALRDAEAHPMFAAEGAEGRAILDALSFA